MLSKNFPTEALINWFIHNQRQLPWRENRTAYRVWVSEVMLQQTTVATVIPYFNRWFQIFPTIKSLSEAKEDLVLKMWEGLGYYSRARSLYYGSQLIVKDFQGHFPENEKDISLIKGIGPYTLNAILAFAFKKRVCPVDGNVLRVLSRFFAINESILLAKTIKRISFLANSILPEKDFMYVSEGLIELGALVCRKKALCDICPLKNCCGAYQKNLVDILPNKPPKQKTQKIFRVVGVIKQGESFFAFKQKGSVVMSGLYEFPYVSMNSLDDLDIKHYEKVFSLKVNCSLQFVKKLKVQKHTFTSFKVTLIPLLFEINSASFLERNKLFLLKDLLLLPFSSGHKKILQELVLIDTIC